MNITEVPINELKEYERNPRKNDASVEYVANSIREFGFKVPVVIDQENTIVCGHTRVKAARNIGMKTVPCIIADDLTDEQIKAFRLADNKAGEHSEWLDSLLDLELLNIENLDMSKFGFDLGSLGETGSDIGESARDIKSMEIKAFEHWDYLVFVFDNQSDWLNVVNLFGIEKVNAGYGITRKIGVGRVVNGKRLLEKLGYSPSDIEPWQSEIDNES